VAGRAVTLSVRWVAKEGEKERVAALLRQLVPLSRSEPGCLQYDVHRVADEPRVFILWERYADEAALDAHTAAPHVQALVFEQALPLLEERVRTYLHPLG
jgi:quinol monooxygenase YgiN